MRNIDNVHAGFGQSSGRIITSGMSSTIGMTEKQPVPFSHSQLFFLVTVRARGASPHRPNVVDSPCYIRIVYTDLSRSRGNELKTYN
jgi:hypothetical protein